MKKKVLCALLCTAMVASLTACGSSSSKPADTSADTAKEESTDAADDTAEADTADAAASEGGRIFGYTCMDGTNPFFVTLEGAIREVVEAHGDTLISMDPANDSNTQINQIEDMISRGAVQDRYVMIGIEIPSYRSIYAIITVKWCRNHRRSFHLSKYLLQEFLLLFGIRWSQVIEFIA